MCYILQNGFNRISQKTVENDSRSSLKVEYVKWYQDLVQIDAKNKNVIKV